MFVLGNLLSATAAVLGIVLNLWSFVVVVAALTLVHTALSVPKSRGDGDARSRVAPRDLPGHDGWRPVTVPGRP